MSNTYTCLHVHGVFAVKYRGALIHPSWKDRLHQFITGTVQHHQHKMLCINSMPDHVHLFFGLHPEKSVSDIMRIVKSESSKWINNMGFLDTNFRWQSGYGAFSYARSQVKTVCTYIENQEAHHRKPTFANEYQTLLRKFDVPFDTKYLFHEPG